MLNKSHLMLDIETMSINVDAPIIQIGACYFEPKTKKITKEFIKNVCLDSCLKEGFKKDKATEEWWSKQDQDVLTSIQSNTVSIAKAIFEFSGFFKQADYIWSHSTFDFVIVNNYLKYFNYPTMNFRKAMDITSLVQLSGIDKKSYNWDNKTHNALDDCKFQVGYCSDAINKILGEINVPS